MFNQLRKAQGGFTLVEVSIILFVLVILSSILLVNLGSYNRLARYARAKEDLGALCSAIASYILDTGETAFYEWGGRGYGGYDSDTPERDHPIGLLVGDGDTPTLNWRTPGADGQKWQSVWRDSFDEYKDISHTSVDFRVDTFANHLIQNEPLHDPRNAYRTPSDMLSGADSAGIRGGLKFDSSEGEGFNSRFAWRGPYIADRVDPDPWGNRYMANVFGLYTPADMTSDGFGTAVVCYTAGPDEEIDTAFNQPYGWTTGDDDITALAHSGGQR